MFASLTVVMIFLWYHMGKSTIFFKGTNIFFNPYLCCIISMKYEFLCHEIDKSLAWHVVIYLLHRTHREEVVTLVGPMHCYTCYCRDIIINLSFFFIFKAISFKRSQTFPPWLKFFTVLDLRGSEDTINQEVAEGMKQAGTELGQAQHKLEL